MAAEKKNVNRAGEAGALWGGRFAGGRRPSWRG